LAGDLCGPGRLRRSAGDGHDRLIFDQGAPLGFGGAKRGERVQAIGRSRGGRTTKIHLLVDEKGRPHVLQLTAGQASDIKAAFALIAQSRPSLRLLADRAYDGDALRRTLADRGTTPVIPNKINRVNRFAFDRDAYRLRNAVERAFCRLKDFRAVATRYDKLARNFLAGVCIAAAIDPPPKKWTGLSRSAFHLGWADIAQG
jgi:transposase